AGELKIACPEPIAAILTPMIDPFFRKYPRVLVHVNQVDNRTLQLPALRDRQCDLVLGHFWPPLLDDSLADDVNVEILLHDRLVVAAGMHSRWSRRKVDLADLVDEPWVLTPPDSLSHRIMSDAFRSRGLHMPQVRLVCRATINMRIA